MDYEFLILALLLILSGFFSGAEIALFSLSKIKIRTLLEQDKKNAKLVAKLKRHPQKLLITILVGNNIVNIAASAIATVVAIDMFGSRGAGIAVGVMTFAILLFGELLPKAIANKHAAGFALKSSVILNMMMWVLTPLILVLEGFLNLFMRVTGTVNKTPIVTEEELKSMLAIGEEEGQVEKEERELIERVFEFNDITAHEVMTPKKNIFMLNAEKTVKGCTKAVVETGYSRIPVFKGSKDHIVGLVFVKDMFKMLANNKGNIKLKEIMVKPHVVPEDKILDDLFKEFQKNRMHMALVVDEYGEVSGIVTLEDLLEELVGEIIDETDVLDEFIMRVDKNTVLVNGDTRIIDVESFLNVDISPSKRITVAKFLLRKLGGIPKEGKKFKMDSVRFVVKKVDNHAIREVAVIKIE